MIKEEATVKGPKVDMQKIEKEEKIQESILQDSKVIDIEITSSIH